MRGLMPIAGLGLCLAGCGAADKASVPEVIAAADLIQAGQVARLAGAIDPGSDTIVAASVPLTLNEAANALVQDGAVLRAGQVVPQHAAAHLEAVLPALEALRVGYAAAGPAQAAQAGRAAGVLDAYLAAVRIYDADAPAAGLSAAALPDH